MDTKLRFIVGLIGNAASLLLYTAPIVTFTSIIRKKSTQEFSCVPYIVALLNCLIYTWYGLPVVSQGWENFTLITINGLGIFMETSFVIIYLWFASTRGKVKVAAITLPVLAVFCASAVISAFRLESHRQRKLFVGSVGLVVSVAMYSAPLVVVKQVIETKSVKYMPFHLSFFSFLSSSVWLVYGLLSQDLILASPGFVGCPLGIVQLALYFKYREIEIKENTNEWDLEKNNDENTTKQVQLGNNSDVDQK